MKRIITSLFCAFALISQVKAQTAETAVTGASYADNVWYSLENGTVKTENASNWDIALAATASQSSPLITSVLINPKVGRLFVIPEATPDNFDEAQDITGIDLSSNSEAVLYNDDKSWGGGAFTKASTGGLDFGFGSYNPVTSEDPYSHGIKADKVFLIEYSTSPKTYKKLYISLSTKTSSYELVYSNLDNTDPHSETIPVTLYSTKNFVYYSLKNNEVLDREPAKTTWDLLFTQFISISENYKSDLSSPGEGAANQLVTGVLLNQGVKAAQANNVDDQATYQDYAAQTFSSDINTIGWDWKYLNASFQWRVVSDTVFFVKLGNGDIYTLYFTNFGGGTSGTYDFTQEKLDVVTSLFGGTTKASLALYPNPSSTGSATVVYDFNGSSEALLSVADLSGNVLYTENMSAQAGLNTYNFPTTSLNPGMYVVSVKVNGGILQQKLVVR